MERSEGSLRCICNGNDHFERVDKGDDSLRNSQATVN